MRRLNPSTRRRCRRSCVFSEPVRSLLLELQEVYRDRGITLVEVAGKWTFRTAVDLAGVLAKHRVEERKLSRAALETLAIIAYHQPVTRAEIEDIRGVATSAGTLDILMEAGWVRPRGRRRAPGKPLTYGTTESFLAHFGLKTVKDLPGLSDLKAQGLLDGTLPPGFAVPDPRDVASLMPDELPLDAEDAAEDDAPSDEDARGTAPETVTARRPKPASFLPGMTDYARMPCGHPKRKPESAHTWPG